MTTDTDKPTSIEVLLKSLEVSSDYVSAQAEAVNLTSPGVAIGAKSFPKIFGNTAKILDWSMTAKEIYDTPSETVEIISNKAKSTMLGIQVQGWVTLATIETGPTCVFFGAVAGQIATLGYDFHQYKKQQAIGAPQTNVTASLELFGQSDPSKGLMTTLYDKNGETFTIRENFLSGEVTYSKASDDIFRLRPNANGAIEEYEITKGANNLKVNFSTGAYTLKGNDGISHAGNLSSSSITATEQNILNTFFASYNSKFSASNPLFNSYAEFVPTVTKIGTSSALSLAGGDHIFGSGNLTVQTGTGGNFEISYRNLALKHDNLNQTLIEIRNPTNGQISGILYKADGSKELFYTDPNAPSSVVHQTFTDYTGLTAQQRIVAEYVTQQSVALLKEGGSHVVDADGTLLNPATLSGLPPALAQQLLDVLGHGAKAETEQGKAYALGEGVVLSSLDGATSHQATSLGSKIFKFGEQELLRIVKSGPDAVRGDAFWDLYALAKTQGTLTTNAAGHLQLALAGGTKFELTIDPATGNQVTLMKDSSNQVVAAVTRNDDSAFKNQVLEILNPSDHSALVQIGTFHDGLGLGFKGEPIKVVFPENFALSSIGGEIGSLLGSQLANGNHIENILYSSLLKTAAQHFGTFGDLIAMGNSVEASAFVATEGANTAVMQSHPDLAEGFFTNLNGQLSGVLGSLLVDQFAAAVDLDGVAGEIATTAANAVTVQFVSQVIDVIFGDLDRTVLQGLADGHIDFTSQGIVNSLGSALGSYAGNHLAGAIVDPENTQAAVFGQIGSIAATYVTTTAGTVVAGQTVGQAIAAALSISANFFAPLIGTAIGAFIGNVLGTTLGNLFGGDDDQPSATARVGYNVTLNDYIASPASSHAGGDAQVAASMAQQVMNGVNQILDLTGGILRETSRAPSLSIGYEGNSYLVNVGGGEHTFSTSMDAITYAAFALLKNFDLVGGHAVLMRAWHNSDATNLFEFREDIQTGEAFQNYLTNPTGIVAMMLNNPESEAAQAWATILKRAEELKLHLPSADDFDGGWGEVLRAQGVDPSLIPNIDGDNIVMTNPVTGEEVILQHVIGPGYEIVRVDGTDGDDVIQVKVNGASISYVDAGSGNDIVDGSEQSDIIVGGAGNDTLNGHGGNDWLHGGQGDDTIDGGTGADLVIGGTENDLLIGGDGDDKIYGNAGDDILQAGSGGNDRLYGGAGNDTLQGNVSNLTHLHGEDGNDILVGATGNSLYGGKGNDEFRMTGSAYNNWAIIGRGEGHDTIICSSLQNNVLSFDATIGGNELFFQRIGSDLKILLLGEDQSVTIKQYFDGQANIAIRLRDGGYEAYGMTAINTLVQADAALSAQPSGQYNVLTDAVLAGRNYNWANVWIRKQMHDGALIQHGTNASNPNLLPSEQMFKTIYGWAGNDHITSNNNSVYIHDTLYGDSGNDIIASGKGDDRLVGGLGDDTLSGAAHNDKLFGGHGTDTLWGGSENDLLDGGAGNDFLYGETGDDQLFGGDGNDTLDDSSGNNLMRGGAGDDILTATTSTTSNSLYGDDGIDTLTSGSGDDTLSGGAGNDTINAGSGDDWVNGDAGDDTAYGSSGNDVINGGDGVDTLRGDSGSDELHGGAGNDDARGGSGNDTVYGDDGDDRVEGDTGHDNLHGGNGIDTMRGEEGYDILYGDAGNDDVRGGEGNNVLYGGDGDDMIVGGAADTDTFVGNDKLYGGAGNDILRGILGDDLLDGGDGNDDQRGGLGNDTYIISAGLDRITEAGGIDTLILGSSLILEDLEFKINPVDTGDLLIVVDAGLNEIELENQFGTDSAQFLDTLQFGDGFSLDLSRYNQWMNAVTAGSTILGTSVNDIIIGKAGADTLKGNAGVDVIHGADGMDILYGGDGNDVLHGGNGDDELKGEAGNDTLYGGAGIDMLRGYTGMDIMYGGAGSDTLRGYEDNDTLRGGDGDDKLYGEYDNSSTYASDDILDGGAGNDLMYGGLGNDTYYYTTGVDYIYDTAGNDRIVFAQGVELDDLTFATSTTDTNDVFITLNAGVNSIEIENQLSTIDYRLDTLAFADGFSVTFSRYQSWIYNASGTSGDDTIIGNATAQTLSGGLGNDEIYGGAGVDTIRGDDGMDILLGGDGVDDVRGGTGADKIWGGAGDDTLVGGSSTTDTFADNDEIHGGDGIDTIRGERGSDLLFGDAGNDIMYGGEDNDELHGGTGDDELRGERLTTDTYASNDLLYGDEGVDKLYGFLGNDILNGGTGQDSLYGGGGADKFVFTMDAAFEAVDDVEDFSVAESDSIDLSAVLSEYDSVTMSIADFVQISVSGTNSTLSVDRDGAGINFTYDQIAIIRNVTGLDVATMQANGSLLTV